jgi:hypothetical protein
MTLAAGSRLGSYIIEAPIGAGGMGEVYRARSRARSETRAHVAGHDEEAFERRAEQSDSQHEDRVSRSTKT